MELSREALQSSFIFISAPDTGRRVKLQLTSSLDCFLKDSQASPFRKFSKSVSPPPPIALSIAEG